MKRHIQKTGVRKFFGQDFVDLQAEPLAVLDGFFAEYGACIIQGCAITQADGGTFDVASGLVALKAFDPNSGAEAIHVMPFEGINKVALPLYLVAEWVVVERAYGDGKVKPIAYNLRAVASGVEPEAPHLVLNAVGANRFVDALQDGTHRFVSDAERSKWNDILRQAKEYAAAQAQAAKGSSVEYTDQTAVALRDELALGDQAALRTAKEYADRIVAALVDGSPELLNTLAELAAALGGDPNFATTVMQAIGERATNTNFNTHTQSGAHVTTNERTTWNNKVGNVLVGNGDLNAFVNVGFYYFDGDMILNAPIKTRNCRLMVFGITGRCTQFASVYDTDRLFFRRQDKDILQWSAWVELYHSGNFDPATKAAATHTHSSVDLVGVFKGLDVVQDADNVGMGIAQVGARGVVSLHQHKYNELQFDYPFDAAKQGTQLRFRQRNNDTSGRFPWYELYHSGNLDKAKLDALPAKIIRGSVDAGGGNGGGNADGIGSVYGEPAVVRVTHNLNTTAYSATATGVSNGNSAHTDNVVSVWRKGAGYVDFVVTAGPDSGRELCAFDFIIIPY